MPLIDSALANILISANFGSEEWENACDTANPATLAHALAGAPNENTTMRRPSLRAHLCVLLREETHDLRCVSCMSVCGVCLDEQWRRQPRDDNFCGGRLSSGGAALLDTGQFYCDKCGPAMLEVALYQPDIAELLADIHSNNQDEAWMRALNREATTPTLRAALNRLPNTQKLKRQRIIERLAELEESTMPTKTKAVSALADVVSQEAAEATTPAKKKSRAKIECKSCGAASAQPGSDFCSFCDPAEAIAKIAKGEATEGLDQVDALAAPAPTLTEAPQVLEISGDAQRPGDRFERVARHLIEPNPYQPRRTFDETKLQELAASIKATRGPLQPPIVREHPEWEPGTMYQLIAGERRHRACELAGIDELNVVVRVATDRELAELSIIENDDREDVSPIDVALAYQRLVQDLGVPVVDVAARVGKDKSVISNAMRLLSLPPSAQQLVATGELSPTHARALCRWKSFPRFVAWYAQLIVENPGSIKARDVEQGYPCDVANWKQIEQAKKEGIFSDMGWQYREAAKAWAKETPQAFVPSFYSGGRRDNHEFICLDVVLLKALKHEADQEEAARQYEEKVAKGLPVHAKTAEEVAQEATAARRKVLQENKDKRAKLSDASSKLSDRVQRHLDDMDSYTKMLGTEEDAALLSEIIALAVTGALSTTPGREAFRTSLQKHGVANKWIDKYLGGMDRRESLAELAKKHGLLFVVAVFGEGIAQANLAESIKHAGAMPTSAASLSTALSIGATGSLLAAFSGD